MRTPKKGDEVRIQFHDHMSNATKPHSYIIWGRIEAITDEAITLDHWVPADSSDDRVIGTSVENFVILRKVIQAIAVVVEWKEL